MIKKKKNKWGFSLPYITAGIGIIVISIIWVVYAFFFALPSQKAYDGPLQEVVVSGSSLSGIVEDGAVVYAATEYYKNGGQPEKDDIVLYKYSSVVAPLIKIIKGVAGDSWRVEKDPEKSSYYIFVNDERITNSDENPYKISSSRARTIIAYAKNYPIIPEDSVLILSNNTSGGKDSTRFGLVSVDDLIGKILLER